MEEILTRVPVPTLLISVLVSKLWYNSIHNDHKRLTYSHFLQSQKQPQVILRLSNVRAAVDTKTGDANYGCHFFKITTGLYSHDNVLRFEKFRTTLTQPYIWELVGYCNGLPCMAQVASIGKLSSNAHIVCHGFGFDSLANEYKLIRAPTRSDKSGIFCTTSNGCLVWKIITTLGGAGSNSIQHDNSNAVNNEMEMLMSFNLHDEEFQFIHLPTKSATDEQQKHLLVYYPHLLEFKGSPCVARIEKSLGNGSDYPHRCRDDDHGSSSCCCCCKVHLYILKDKVKQMWVKEEGFDVRTSSTSTWLGHLGHLAPDPCCFCFGSTTTPPTRIFSFSDQILLYWFSGNYLQVYNMRSEKQQLVLPGFHREDRFFQSKMKEPRHIFISGDDDTYCSKMDYQLHRHEENFLSLQTFIPEGVTGVDADAFREMDLKRQDRPCLAYVSIYRGSRVFYAFFS
ncbi:hypothetical protein C5167_007160 [Papaver somniferum]|uniref:Uncharacterized protein n=1 Tax=Papaver somniferum TaxID=3469 RepID=A0A4Y7JH45_PAPSO|nr:hypothetical protein C5167_007160 [Papaver somniferum]